MMRATGAVGHRDASDDGAGIADLDLGESVLDRVHQLSIWNAIRSNPSLRRILKSTSMM